MARKQTYIYFCMHRYEVIDTPTDIYVVMEYVSGGELFDYIVAKVCDMFKNTCTYIYIHTYVQRPRYAIRLRIRVHR